MTLTLTSSAYNDGGAIPAKYTCEGEDISPRLAWSCVPDGTRNLVLIIDDPDAPDPKPPETTWVHWVLYNIPPDVTVLAEAMHSDALPGDAQEGLNDWQRTGYGGPCPPIGRHRYFHKLYALDMMLEHLSEPEEADVEAVMHGHVIGQAQLVAT